MTVELTDKQMEMLVKLSESENNGNPFLFTLINQHKTLAEHGLVEVNPDITEGAGIKKKLATRLTQEGYNVLNGTEGAESKPKKQESKMTTFKIVNDVPVPETKGRSRSHMYPFADMEVNQSFFVPATEQKPEPWKTLAAAVTTANSRFSEPDPSGETRINRAGTEVPVTRQIREFTYRRVDNGEAWGYPDVSGVAVFRIQ